MTVSPARDLILRPGYEDARRRFVQDLPRVVGAVPVAGYLPHRDDLLTSLCPWSGKVWTAGATVSGQLDPTGGGTSRRFLSASTQYSSTPDTTDTSFGNGTTDSPFSLLVLANVTDTAATRALVTKWHSIGSAAEWLFQVIAADNLRLHLFDQSAVVQAFRTSDAVVAQGSWRLFSATYTAATGGATAANDITLYQDGAVIASTAGNAGTYVAMENLTALPMVGAVENGTTSFMDGSIACAVVVPRALTAADHAAAAALFRRLFGVPT